MKKVFFISLIFFLGFPLSSLAGTCPWTNIYNNDKVEYVTPNVKPGRGPDGEAIKETCAEAVARRRQQVEKSHAYKNAGNTITGGSRHACEWTSPNLPNAPSQTYTLQVRKIGEGENGEPKYESCASAQRRRQQQWINHEFNGHREDAEAAIAAERQRLEEKAMSANEKARKASEKQKKTSMIAIAGGMAAGVTAAACYSSCSSPGGCCPAAPYFAALAAGLGLAGMMLGLASKDNDHIAAEYQGGLLPHMGGGGQSDGNFDLGTTDGGVIVPPGGNLPTPTLITTNDPPEITLPNGRKVTPTPANFRRVLKEQGLKWDPNKKSITLPNGKSYSAEDTNNPEFRKYASSGQAQALQNQMKGLEGQIAKAMGDEGGSGDLGSGLEGEEGDAALGGGGFAGYGGGGAGAGGALMAANGRGPGSAGGAGGSDNKGSKVAGMSVKMGKSKVGVSQDNIFEMIHRRYQAKRKKRQFIELNL